MRLHRKVRRNEQTGQNTQSSNKSISKRRKINSRLAAPASPALMGLPKITAAIPRNLVIPSNSINIAQIALIMYETGLLSEADCVDKDRNPSTLIKNAFSRWFDNIKSSLTIFDLNLYLTDSVCNLEPGFYEEDLYATTGFTNEQQTLFVGAFFDGWHRYYLKEGIDLLESIIPGLGATTYDVLQSKIWETSTSLTPDFLIDTVRYLYWGGCENETDYMAECYDEMTPEEQEDFRENEIGIVYDDIKDLNPVFETEKLTEEQLSVLLKHTNPVIAKVADLLLKKDNYSQKEKNFPRHLDSVGNDTQCTDIMTWIQWEPDRISERIADDWYQYACESGTSQISVFWMCEVTAEGIQSMFSSIEQYVKQLTWLEKLIQLVGKEAQRN